MPLLHIYDSSNRLMTMAAAARKSFFALPVENVEDLIPELDIMLMSGVVFDRVLFNTHGNAGVIEFNEKPIMADYWRLIKGRYNMLVTRNAKVYFNGCSVAADEVGWQFLEAAAGVFMTSGGGEVIGQTDDGWVEPFNGHTIHPWGYTRTIIVDNDGNTKRWEHRDLF